MNRACTVHVHAHVHVPYIQGVCGYNYTLYISDNRRLLPSFTGSSMTPCHGRAAILVIIMTSSSLPCAINAPVKRSCYSLMTKV